MSICCQFIFSSCPGGCGEYHPGPSFITLVRNEIEAKGTNELCKYYADGCIRENCRRLHIGSMDDHFELVCRIISEYIPSIYICEKCFFEEHDPRSTCHQKLHHFHQGDLRSIASGARQVCKIVDRHDYLMCPDIHMVDRKLRMSYIVEEICIQSREQKKIQDAAFAEENKFSQMITALKEVIYQFYPERPANEYANQSVNYLIGALDYNQL